MVLRPCLSAEAESGKAYSSGGSRSARDAQNECMTSADPSLILAVDRFRAGSPARLAIGPPLETEVDGHAKYAQYYRSVADESQEWELPVTGDSPDHSPHGV